MKERITKRIKQATALSLGGLATVGVVSMMNNAPEQKSPDQEKGAAERAINGGSVPEHFAIYKYTEGVNPFLAANDLGASFRDLSESTAAQLDKPQGVVSSGDAILVDTRTLNNADLVNDQYYVPDDPDANKSGYIELPTVIPAAEK